MSACIATSMYSVWYSPVKWYSCKSCWNVHGRHTKTTGTTNDIASSLSHYSTNSFPLSLRYISTCAVIIIQGCIPLVFESRIVWESAIVNCSNILVVYWRRPIYIVRTFYVWSNSFISNTSSIYCRIIYLNQIGVIVNCKYCVWLYRYFICNYKVLTLIHCQLCIIMNR